MSQNYPIDRKGLKENAKELIRTLQPKTWMVALVYLLATSWVSQIHDLANPVMVDLNRAIALVEAGTSEGIYQAQSIIAGVFGTPGGYITIFLSIVLSLYTMVVNYGYTGYALRAVRGERPGYGEIFSRFYMAGRIILAEILMAVFVFLWSMLFIIPGLIAAYRYQMIPYILLDDPDCSVMEAFRRSKALMRGRKWELFVLEMSFFLWAVGAAALSGLVQVVCGRFLPDAVVSCLSLLVVTAFYLFLEPYQQFTFAQWYLEIQPRTGEADESQEPPLYQ